MEEQEGVDLPEEIINLISSFASAPAKRLLASTCKKWHRKLFDNHFTFYFTNKTSIQSIVEHILVHYPSIPISMQFKKSVDRGIVYYTQHLAKLTNLTSLSLDRPDGDSFDGEWLRLTTLTNLTYFDECPMILQPIFTQLRSFNYNKHKFGTSWRKFTNLEMFQCSVSFVSIDPFLFISNPTKLTALIIKNNSVATTNPEIPKLFTNLKKFVCFGNAQSNGFFQLDLLTSLEYLKISSANFERIDSLIHLTRLVLSGDHYFNMDRIIALKKLKRLSFIRMFQMQDNQLQFLADLTALESLRLEARGLRGEFFQWINNSNLTRLNIWYCGNQPAQFKFLTNLRKLDLFVSDRQTRITYEYISDLTLLKSFTCEALRNTIAFFLPFTNLKKLSVPNLYAASTLPNLESLDCNEISEVLFNEFRLLTKLTSLKCHLDSHWQNDNITLLSKLPLREFCNRAVVSRKEFFSELSRMTALERLQVERLADFSILRDMTRLTYLETNQNDVKLENLSLLTSLQIIKLPVKTIPEEIKQHLTRLYEYL